MSPMQSGAYTIASSADGKAIVQQMAVNVQTILGDQGIDDAVRGFAEGSKVLMKALDAVAQIHPFISSKFRVVASNIENDKNFQVAVLAFKAVIMLDLTRRENDRKIIALKLKMSDMMSVLQS